MSTNRFQMNSLDNRGLSQEEDISNEDRWSEDEHEYDNGSDNDGKEDVKQVRFDLPPPPPLTPTKLSAPRFKGRALRTNKRAAKFFTLTQAVILVCVLCALDILTQGALQRSLRTFSGL